MFTRVYFTCMLLTYICCTVKPKKSLPHTLRRFTAHVASSDDVTNKVNNQSTPGYPSIITINLDNLDFYSALHNLLRRALY